MADDLSHDDEGGLPQHLKCGQEPQGAVRHLDRQLAHQAFYYVRHGKSVLLRGVQGVHHTGACYRISCRCSTVGCCALHGNGLCVERTDQGRFGIHGGAGGHQRPDYPRSIRPYREVLAGRFECVRAVGYANFVGGAVRGHSPFRWYADTVFCDPEKGKRVF